MIASPDHNHDALALWRRRLPISEGTSPWRYLREARGYQGPIPATLGHLPARDAHPASLIAAYGLPTEPEPGALAIADADVKAVHLTRFEPDGTKVAGKITIGSPLGSPIVLAPPNDLLGMSITEDVEDALSVHAATNLGAWAAGLSAYMPALAPVVPDWIDHLTIIAHHDPSGMTNAAELAAALDARGIRHSIFWRRDAHDQR